MSTASKDKWNAAHYDTIKITVKKGKKDVIKAHAESRGESVNAFLARAADEAIARDNGETPSESAKNAATANASGVEVSEVSGTMEARSASVSDGLSDEWKEIIDTYNQWAEMWHMKPEELANRVTTDYAYRVKNFNDIEKLPPELMEYFSDDLMKQVQTCAAASHQTVDEFIRRTITSQMFRFGANFMAEINRERMQHGTARQGPSRDR